jgi:membrane associated rhomboid family serine protease
VKYSLPGRGRITPLTLTLIVICVIIALASNFGRNIEAIFPFLISQVPGTRLPEILSGEIWRLITPIFIHFGIIHILFNSLWLYDLGSAIEQLKGSPHLGMLIGIIGVCSNLAEYYWSGPLFGGMSGVVYGLLGYVWILGRLNPRGPLQLHPQIAIMMMIWFVLCWSGLIGGIANMAHTVGLVSGLLLGYVFSPNKKLIR